MAREIFVSYAQSDRDCALKLPQIIEVLSAARALVLLGNSDDSPEVRREVERVLPSCRHG